MNKYNEKIIMDKIKEINNRNFSNILKLVNWFISHLYSCLNDKAKEHFNVLMKEFNKRYKMIIAEVKRDENIINSNLKKEVK